MRRAERRRETEEEGLVASHSQRASRTAATSGSSHFWCVFCWMEVLGVMESLVTSRDCTQTRRRMVNVTMMSPTEKWCVSSPGPCHFSRIGTSAHTGWFVAIVAPALAVAGLLAAR